MGEVDNQPHFERLPEIAGKLEEVAVVLGGVAQALAALTEADVLPPFITRDEVTRLETTTGVAREAVGAIATATAMIVARHEAIQDEVVVAAATQFATTSGYFTLTQLRQHLVAEGLIQLDTNFRTLFNGGLKQRMENHMLAQGIRVTWLRGDGRTYALAFIASPPPRLRAKPPAPLSAEEQTTRISHNMSGLFGEAPELSRKVLLSKMAATWGTLSHEADRQLHALAASGILTKVVRKGTVHYVLGTQGIDTPAPAKPLAEAASKPTGDPAFTEEELTAAAALFDHFSNLTSEQAQSPIQQQALQRLLRRTHPQISVTQGYGVIIDRLVQRGYLSREIARGRRKQGKVIQLDNTYKVAWRNNRIQLLGALGQPSE
ncbi:MAG: hypothetical protein AAB834_07220 [Patescibacteria group bacterium]